MRLINKKKGFITVLSVVIFIVVLYFAFIAPNLNSEETAQNSESEIVEVHFIDVGQGDSILIEAGGKALLIDAGENDMGDTVVSYIKSQGITKLDYVIATHPHSDHIGGLDTVINGMDVENVILPKVEHTTKTYEDLLDAVIENEVKVITPKVGAVYAVGPAFFTIIAPNSLEYNNLNNYSVAIKLTYKEVSFVFTADAEKLSEKEMLAAGLDLRADILKVPHHGSNTSSDDDFLDVVRPFYGIISVGADNQYGLPTEETLEKLEERNITVYRTDLHGTIIVSTDGHTINIDKEKS